MKNEQGDTMNDESALTTSELANLTGESPRTIQRAIKGGLPVVRGGNLGRGNSARVTLREYELYRATQGKPLRLKNADVVAKTEKAFVDVLKRDAFTRDPRYSAPAHKLLGIPEPIAMAYLIHAFERVSLALTGESQPLPSELANWLEVLRQRERRNRVKKRHTVKIPSSDISKGNHDRT